MKIRGLKITMNALLTDLLAVFGVVLNALPQDCWRCHLDLRPCLRRWRFIGAVGNVVTGKCSADFVSGGNHNLCGNQRQEPFGAVHHDLY